MVSDTPAGPAGTSAPAPGTAAVPITAREPLVARMRPFGTTIFAEMSALAVRTGSVNLGQGFPDTDGPRRCSEAAVEAIRGGRNQYPPGPGIPELRAAIADHQQRVLGARVRPGRRGAGDRGRHRGDRRGDARAVRDRRRGGRASSRTTTPTRPRSPWPARVRRLVALRPPDGRLPSTPTSCAAAVGPRTRLVLLNSPHNPTGKVFSRDELDADRRTVPRARPDRGHRRGVRAPRLRRRAHPAGHAARHARTHRARSRRPARRSPSPAGRWAGPAARPRWWRRCARSSSSSPRQRRRRCSTRSPSRSACPRRTTTGFRDALRDKRDRLCAGLAEAGFGGARPGRDVLRHGRHHARSAGDPTGWRSAGSLPERCGVVAVPDPVFYDDAEVARPPGPVRVLQARRGTRRGGRPPAQTRYAITGTPGRRHPVHSSRGCPQARVVPLS